MIFNEDSHILLIGDSITDTGRTRPLAQSQGQYGTGYVGILEAMLSAFVPEHTIKVTNMGNSGDTTRKLVERWESDVVSLKPDYLTIMIGINDVWRHFDRPHLKGTLVDYKEFEDNYRTILESTIMLGTVKEIFVLSAFFLEPNRGEPMRAMVDAYNSIAKDLCTQYGVQYVDIQEAFDTLMLHKHPMAIAWDRVHVNQAGHTLIAHEVFKVLGGKL